MHQPIDIDPDIRRARTLPGWCYRDSGFYRWAIYRLFARSWQIVADADEAQLGAQGTVLPFRFLAGSVDEPLLLVRDQTLRCLSNVCTHRGNLLVGAPGTLGGLRCRYHGRRFGLDGRALEAPGFEGGASWPGADDHLPRVRLERWHGLLFVALDPGWPLEDVLAPIDQRVGRLPFAELRRDPSRSRTYQVDANWAVYCDNYLESLHIPYVHPALDAGLQGEQLAVELLPWGSLQVGIAATAEDAFSGAPDGGPERQVAAYWFWLFPNLMLNLYPWGISLNVVRPLAVDRTEVDYAAWVWDSMRLDRGAGGALDRVEREDSQVVQSVQLGTGSRLWTRGRYAPIAERAVHHFHRLLADAWNRDPDSAPSR